ncbi:hypothetical protein [Actinomadura sp. SCN-SB]|uniref:hypothetical protein n=1 Tax=Actinomadura sp. SCN-SB TaxID=3373092 RepID=UPI0037525C66
MFFAVTLVVGLVGLLASLVYLLDFARASRRDNLYMPATTGRARRARRVTGMYARSADGHPTFGGETAFVVPAHDRLAAH